MNLGAGQPGKRALVGSLAVVAGVFGLVFLHNIVASLVGAGAVLLSTAELFLPVKCRLDGSGAQSKCGLSVQEIKWGDVRRVVEDDGGVKLSPLAEASRIAPFRGVYLRFSGNSEAVLGTIRAFREGHAESLANGTDG